MFERLGNKYIPTYAGEQYIKSQGNPGPQKELDQKMGDIIKNNEGYLKIGFPAMRGTYMLPCTLPIFHDKYPNVRIDLHEANSESLIQMIIEGDIDLAFSIL